VSAPVPYEESLMADVKRLLELVRSDAGYHTDLEHVFLADERIDDVLGDAVLVNVHDGEEELLTQDAHSRQVRLVLEIEISIPASRENSRAYARRACQDVRRALLQGLSGGSYTEAPVNLTFPGRSIPAMPSGSQYQHAVQRAAFDIIERIDTL
jgi:hypothetical protein